MASSPWNRLAAHWPLGSIMRVRRPVYVAGERFRSNHNGCPIREPRSLDGLPD